jgi:metal-dependent amidase/aminoacylase/carboxypeptidase family protein
MKFFSAGLLCLLFSSASAAQQTKLDSAIDQQLPSLVSIYKGIHAAPELSHHEEKTSALLAEQLRSAGFEVTEHVGKYPNPEWKDYGVVAVMKNGAGPTVLVRADMDALPVEEQTGLPYASHVRAKDDAGQDVGVMHACGHDIHVTTLIGTARMLAALKNEWHGTLVLIGQPAEERIDGARAMLADGLYARFPKPDFALALHDSAGGKDRLSRRLYAGECHFRGRNATRPGRTRRLSAHDEGPHRHGRGIYSRNSNDRQPGRLTPGSRGGDGRLDSWRDQAQSDSG